MSKPVSVIDDVIFGLDKSYKLPVHFGNDWIGKIDAPGPFSRDEYIAMTHASIMLKAVIIDVFTNPIPNGDRRNKLIENYDDNLVAELTKCSYQNPQDKGVFDSYLQLSIEQTLPGTEGKLPAGFDKAFLLTTFGNANRYFGEAMQEPTMIERFMMSITGKKGFTEEHTILSAAATVIDYTTALEDRVIEMTEERKNVLVDSARVFAGIGAEHGVGEALQKLNQAIERLDNAPVLKAIAPGM